MSKLTFAKTRMLIAMICVAVSTGLFWAFFVAWALMSIFSVPGNIALTVGVFVSVVLVACLWNKLGAIMGFGPNGEQVAFESTPGGALRATLLLLFALGLFFWSWRHYSV